ncbi:hypothetical protein GCM10008910_33640 [Faecalicatena orotica]|uniref:Ribosomal processing cysteine protease Prp n=1 Tax=Faecalicatena orotica TaxID=1544 RepID=A0A2Y9BKW2_9FIRM|nr:ribosomal-processing cysteine protease Prp [Faecalicatena orotica]PWJ19462.1 hypothetical protein A8806_12351 [Faecalicatena orotica]SSA58675.1 hypothetical protein SAMN05216536_12351 [Faecalicatena orotica]
MIRVCICKDEITVSGHAGYSVQGSDIVCAGVSVLLQTLVKGILNLTDDKIEYNLAPGKAIVRYEKISEKSKVLIDSFFTGIFMIADAYSDYICII